MTFRKRVRERLRRQPPPAEAAEEQRPTNEDERAEEAARKRGEAEILRSIRRQGYWWPGE